MGRYVNKSRARFNTCTFFVFYFISVFFFIITITFRGASLIQRDCYIVFRCPYRSLKCKTRLQCNARSGTTSIPASGERCCGYRVSFLSPLTSALSVFSLRDSTGLTTAIGLFWYSSSNLIFNAESSSG